MNVLWVIQIPYLFIEGGIQWVHGVIGRPIDWTSSDQSPPGYCSDIRFGLLDGKRNMMVDWLVEVARYWCLLNTTLHLAVDLIDRFLFTVSKFDLDGFEVLALSCLHLAAYHRGNQIRNHRHDATADMMHLTRNEFTAYDFELTEEKVVCHLRQIDVDIAISHIRGPCEQLGGGRLGVTYLLTLYLCELSLMNVCLKRFEPSMVAAAAIHLALHTRNRSSWSAHLTARYRIFLVTAPKPPSHS